MRNILPLILLTLSAMLLSGCGQTKVTGTVSFPDGSPLTTGTIIFEDDKNSYTATIKDDGSFKMGMLKDGEGIPPGQYRVAIMAVDPESDNDVETQATSKARFLTHPKYASSRTSGITYDVQKNMNITITVEKPAGQ